MYDKRKKVILKDILEPKGYIRGPFGSALKRGELLDKGIPVYEQQHAITNSRTFRFFINNEKFESMKRFQVKDNDLIISCSGTVGCVSIIGSDDPKGIISQALLILRANTDIVLPQYLKYFFASREGYNAIVSRSSGSVQVNIAKREIIEQIEIDLPDIPTQRKIVKILESLDDKITINKKINDNLQQQVSALFDAWFVSFIKTDGEMPTDWHEGTLGDIASITSGKRPPMKQATASADVTIPLVGAASIMGFTNTVLYNEPILVTGRVGTHGIVQRFQSPCWTSDNTLVIKSDFYEFTFQVLQRVDYVNMNRGSTQPLITQTDLKNVSIVIPTEEVLLEYEKLAGSLMAMYESNRKENERLAALRDALLPRLMSGEIDVSDFKI